MSWKGIQAMIDLMMIFMIYLTKPVVTVTKFVRNTSKLAYIWKYMEGT